MNPLHVPWNVSYIIKNLHFVFLTRSGTNHATSIQPQLKPWSNCPGSAPVCPGEDKPVYHDNRETAPSKIDCVLTDTV